MLALVGFALGYVIGAKEGQEGLERMIASTKAVLASDEFKAALEGAQAMAGGMLKQAFDQFTGAAAGEGRNIVSRLRAA
ncbi:MAG TPA: hypothetical protein VJS45_17655 [Acidimicrobiia bacterium]|jgi:CheY-specific phosphatase CheX|nr:hypothetical protein [Acidimicrobiia bacterium]